MTKYSKIAISLPENDLRSADALAKALDRPRSWVIAEALRRYAVAHLQAAEHLDATRQAQLLRDLALPVAERLRAGEAPGVVPALPAATRPTPRRFATYDDFAAWRKASRDRV